MSDNTPTDDELLSQILTELYRENTVHDPIPPMHMNAMRAAFVAGRASVTQPQAYSIWTPLGFDPTDSDQR